MIIHGNNVKKDIKLLKYIFFYIFVLIFKKQQKAANVLVHGLLELTFFLRKYFPIVASKI